LISSADVWQQVAQAILLNWSELDAHPKGGPVQALQMLQKCGDQQLKARIVAEKGKDGENMLTALNAWRESLFTD